MRRPLEILISGAGIAGPTLAYWLVRRGHRPVLVERTPELRVGGHAVDIRGTALEVIERMGLETEVRDARTQILTLSAVRPDGARTYDVALRPMHEARGDREIEIMRDDLVRILFGAVSDDVEVVFGDSVRTLTPRTAPASPSNSSAAPPGRSIWLSAPTASTRAFVNSRWVPSADSPIISVRICRSTPSTICSGCVTGRCSTTNPAAPRPCSPCAATSARRWCCCSAARRSTSISAIRRLNTMCSVGGSPEWVGTHSRLIESLPDAYDFYFDEMSQVRLPRWSTGRVALLGDAAFGPSPMSGQGTSLALIGAFLLAHHLAAEPDPATALDLWENEFRPNVELNQALATDGMSTLLPASRLGIFARNQTMRVLPLLARFGRGFGGRIERASRAVTLPH